LWLATTTAGRFRAILEEDPHHLDSRSGGNVTGKHDQMVGDTGIEPVTSSV
jgi:hypothetical protein